LLNFNFSTVFDSHREFLDTRVVFAKRKNHNDKQINWMIFPEYITVNCMTKKCYIGKYPM